MTTKITIEPGATEIVVHVTDDTGRDETKVMPRYPRPGSERYVKFVDTLDMMMAEGS